MSTVGKIKFILPAGFCGAFIVAEDPAAPSASQEDEVTVYEIPENGLLRTISVQPLHEWHSATAMFSDGRPLPVATGGPIEPYDQVEIKLYSLYSDANRRNYFLVGTEAEQADALKNRSTLSLGKIEKGRLLQSN
jgi:hypothetical protein